MHSSSSAVKTFPVGLCGVFTTIALVLGDMTLSEEACTKDDGKQRTGGRDSQRPIDFLRAKERILIRTRLPYRPERERNQSPLRSLRSSALEGGGRTNANPADHRASREETPALANASTVVSRTFFFSRAASFLENSRDTAISISRGGIKGSRLRETAPHLRIASASTRNCPFSTANGTARGTPPASLICPKYRSKNGSKRTTSSPGESIAWKVTYNASDAPTVIATCAALSPVA